MIEKRSAIHTLLTLVRVSTERNDRGLQENGAASRAFEKFENAPVKRCTEKYGQAHPQEDANKRTLSLISGLPWSGASLCSSS
jgi:hypothetical protein